MLWLTQQGRVIGTSMLWALKPRAYQQIKNQTDASLVNKQYNQRPVQTLVLTAPDSSRGQVKEVKATSRVWRQYTPGQTIPTAYTNRRELYHATVEVSIKRAPLTPRDIRLLHLN